MPLYLIRTHYGSVEQPVLRSALPTLPFRLTREFAAWEVGEFCLLLKSGLDSCNSVFCPCRCFLQPCLWNSQEVLQGPFRSTALTVAQQPRWRVILDPDVLFKIISSCIYYFWSPSGHAWLYVGDWWATNENLIHWARPGAVWPHNKSKQFSSQFLLLSWFWTESPRGK